MAGRTTALIALTAIALTACGTRVPDEQFEALFGGMEANPDGSGGVDANTPGTGSGDLSGLAPSGGSTAAPGAGGDTPADDGATAGAPGSGTTAGSGPGTGTGSTGNAGGSGAGAGTSGDTGAAPNQASDVGVTATSIKVGNIVSLSGALGPDAFAPSYFGANAYFEYLNQSLGGVHGRTVEFITCDDAEDPGKNQACVDQLLAENVFALVANATRAYTGAERISDAGIPDVMGQPIGNPYWTYPGFFAVRGSEYAQQGEVGYKGRLYGGTTNHLWFKQNLGLTKSAVFYYNVAASKQFGQHIADALRSQGFEVTEFEVNFGLPNFDAAVADMRASGVDNVWDAMDVNGNRNLCRAMDRNNFQVEAKVTTSQGMGRGISNYSYPCRENIYGGAEAVPYSATEFPEVALFQQVMTTLYQGEFDDRLAQWAWEGWLAAKSFTEVVASMGATPTRQGLIDFYQNVERYTLGGMFSPLEWTFKDFDSGEEKSDCIIISKWDEARGDMVIVSENPFCPSAGFVSYEAV